MRKFKSLLPQEARQEFSSLVDEGKSVARVSLQAALDSVAKSMASAVAVRRSSRLQSSGLQQEVQEILQDLPIEGGSFFLEQTDMKEISEEKEQSFRHRSPLVSTSTSMLPLPQHPGDSKQAF